MTPPPPLVDSTGRPFPLGRHLAAGGEGAVYEVPHDTNRVAKVYHASHLPDGVKAEKLTAMAALADPKLTAVAAWPSGLLHHTKTGRVVGFVMPRLNQCEPIQQLYNPVQRLKFFPREGWAFQVRVAQNLAAAFDEVHKAGCLMADVNQSNAMVAGNALVRLIDCDSFQVRANGNQYLCDVGTPHYIPPELQGKSLRGLVRTENHDRFGLAVLLFQLLFVGRHPYAGVYRGKGDPSFEQFISDFMFAHGPLGQMLGMDPPPHTPTLTDIPPDLGALFRRAFERGSETGTRPRPAEWLPALKRLEQNVAACSEDGGHQYWRGSAKCVWCRLAAKGGPEYYFGVAEDANTFAVDEAKLQEILRRLANARLVAFSYNRSRYASSHPVEPDPIPEGLDEHRTMMKVVGVVAGLCALAVPFGLLRNTIGIIGILGLVVFGVWFAILLSTSPWAREVKRRRSRRNRALSSLRDVESEWQQRIRHYQRDHANGNQSVRELVSDCRNLAAQYQGEIKNLAGNAEAAARMRHLRLHLIADADIPKVGAGRKQTLAGHGIFTAADVDWSAISRIKGFGDSLTGSLVAWREEVLRQFRFDPKSAISPSEQRALAVRFRNRQQQLLADAERHLAGLEALAAKCRAALDSLTPELREIVVEWEQAEANLAVMTRTR